MTSNLNSQIGKTTWAKHTYSCGHWNLQRSEVIEDTQTIGGWPHWREALAPLPQLHRSGSGADPSRRFLLLRALRGDGR